MKLKAFTLIEILVTLALLGIVTILGTFIYQSLGGYQSNYFSKVDETYGRLILYEVLESDCKEAYSYTIIQNDLLRLYNKEEEIFAFYQISEEAVLRYNNDKLDSLKTPIQAFFPLNEFKFQIQDSSRQIYVFSLNKRALVKGNKFRQHQK